MARATHLSDVTSSGVPFAVRVTATAHAQSRDGYYSYFKIVDKTPPVIDTEGTSLTNNWNTLATSTGGATLAALTGDVWNNTAQSHTGQEYYDHHTTVSYTNLKKIHSTAYHSIIQHSAGYVKDAEQIKGLDTSTFTCTDDCDQAVLASAKFTMWAWGDGDVSTTHVCGEDGTKTWEPLSTMDNTDLATTGVLLLRYTCTDNADNVDHACRTVYNQDHSLPILNYGGDQGLTVTRQASHNLTYIDQGATCSDAVDGQINGNVIIRGDIVDLRQVGTYRITYECDDAAGNSALDLMRTVIVSDTVCPTCMLDRVFTTENGCNTTDYLEDCVLEASFPVTFNVSAVECFDDSNGTTPLDYTQAVSGTSNLIDVEKTGTYYITYTVTDAHNNSNHADQNGNPCFLCDLNEADGQSLATEGACGTYDGTVRQSQIRTIVIADNLLPIITITPATMAESSSANGWIVGAIASGVAAVALLGYSASRTSAATAVPV